MVPAGQGLFRSTERHATRPHGMLCVVNLFFIGSAILHTTTDTVCTVFRGASRSDCLVGHHNFSDFGRPPEQPLVLPSCSNAPYWFSNGVGLP